jgi:hypothetical protein
MTDELKIGVIKAFYQWMRLKLPENTIIGLTENNQIILEFIFNEIRESESNEELIEGCTDCIIQLISVSKKS